MTSYFTIIYYLFHTQIYHLHLRIHSLLDNHSNYSRKCISVIKISLNFKHDHKTFKNLNIVCHPPNSRTLKLIITPHQSSVQRKPLQLAFESSLISARTDTSKNATSLVTYVACRALSPYVNCQM